MCSGSGAASGRGIRCLGPENTHLELLIEDDQAQPDVALTKTKKLVERDRVHVLMGIIWSPNAVAIRDYVHESKVPLVISEGAARVLTQELREATGVDLGRGELLALDPPGGLVLGPQRHHLRLGPRQRTLGGGGAGRQGLVHQGLPPRRKADPSDEQAAPDSQE